MNTLNIEHEESLRPGYSPCHKPLLSQMANAERKYKHDVYTSHYRDVVKGKIMLSIKGLYFFCFILPP